MWCYLLPFLPVFESEYLPSTIISKKYKAESLEIVTEYRKSIKISNFGHKADIQTPHGPHTRCWDATYPYSSLCQGFYLTNKHIPFKKIKKITLFADDCVCYREIKDEKDTMKLQRDIDQLGS